MSKKRASSKSRSGKNASKRNGGRILWRLIAFFILLLAALAAAYHFGSYGVRVQMERVGLAALQPLRSVEPLPRPVRSLLNRAYDAIPASTGFAVDAGEVRALESPVLLGVPTTPAPVQILWNQSYVNLYNEADKQSVCLAFQVSGRPSPIRTSQPLLRVDDRTPRLKPQDLQMGPWSPQSILPVGALASRTDLETATREAHLASALFPMTDDFAEDIWSRLMETIAYEYPRRFGEIWILTGPVLRTSSSKLSTGVPVPDGFYAIVFDLTENGTLRAQAFIIPTDATSARLADYLTKIAVIEKHTKIRFFPGTRLDSAESLKNWVSPSLW